MVEKFEEKIRPEAKEEEMGEKVERFMQTPERKKFVREQWEQFEQKPSEIKPEVKTKAEQKKERKEHFGELAEVQLAREKAEREAKREKAAIETAEISKEGMKPEKILKEAGIEKPAEFFEDFQK